MAFLNRHHSKGIPPHCISTSFLTMKQNSRLKSPIQDINHHLNQVHPSFDSTNSELKPGTCIVDIFPNCFSFHTVKCNDKIARANHLKTLDNILHTSTTQPGTIIIVTDASTKHGIYAVSVAHGWQNKSLVFNLEYTAPNVTSSEAEIFAIRCGINKATTLEEINQIIVIMDSIQCAQKLFDTSNLSLQGHTIATSHCLRAFFKKTLPTPSIFGTAPVMTDGPYTTKLIPKQSHFNYPYNTPTKSPGITAKNLSATTSFQYGKCSSRTPHTRGTIFWTPMMTMITSSSQHTQKEEDGSILSASQTHCVQEPLVSLPIMFL